jgi:RNA polymerase sigma-70 factor (ECF subfamily)
MSSQVASGPAIRPTGVVTYMPAATGDVADAELVARLRTGDRRALAALFDRYADRLYNHCFRRLGSYADAEDAVSTVFLTVWRTRHRFEVHDGSAGPWLYGVATNVARNLDRSRRRHLRAVSRLGTLDTPEVPDHADAVVGRLAAEQQMEALLARIRTLSRGEQDVLALVIWSGLSYAEAATALGVPIGTVRSRLARARARLSGSAHGQLGARP